MVMFDPYTRPPPSAHRITILGGTGFVGHQLVNRLTQDGHRLKILSRNREAHRDMLVHPNVEVVTANVYDPEALARNFEDVEAVINLVGILNEKGHNGSGFQRAHVDLTRMAANAARKTGVRRFMQMSALGAAADSQSHYQRTKAEAEKLLGDMVGELDVTIFRPSTIFGDNDTFINRFGKLLGQVPIAFPLACAEAKFAPVYVKDVAEMFARTLDDPKSFGRTYELCGPDVLTLQEIVEYVRDLQDRRKPVVPLPDFLSKAQAYVFEFVPGKPFSIDNYRSTQRDNVCAGSNGLRDFSIHPTGMDAIVPWYLTSRRSRILDKFRRHSGGFPRP